MNHGLKITKVVIFKMIPYEEWKRTAEDVEPYSLCYSKSGVELF